MLSINKLEFISYAQNADEQSGVIAEIFVDTSDELPTVDGIDGYTLHQGSSALIISENRLAILSGDGKWYSNGEVIK